MAHRAEEKERRRQERIAQETRESHAYTYLEFTELALHANVLAAPYDKLLALPLGRSRFLVGEKATEADWRLFPTLVRFDVAYFSLFRCNKKRIADYPNLSNYMREVYALPGIAETVKARYYVINYWSIARLNPLGIIPKGTPVDYTQPHDRARLAN